jgi:geranylgeranyl pyrophosphate synthase
MVSVLSSVQVAILAGDFLLARASVSLAALRNSDVMQLFSQVIEDLVSGEIMQVSPPQFGVCRHPNRGSIAWESTAAYIAVCTIGP